MRLKQFLNEATDNSRKITRMKNFLDKNIYDNSIIKNISSINRPKNSMRIEIERGADVNKLAEWITTYLYSDIKLQKSSIVLAGFFDKGKVPNKLKKIKTNKSKISKALDKDDNNAKFGKEFLGAFRGVEEEDTKKEREILDTIVNFFNNQDAWDMLTDEENTIKIDNKFKKVVKELLSQKKYYPKLLKPENKKLYKVVRMNKDNLSRICKKNNISPPQIAQRKSERMEKEANVSGGQNVFNIGSANYNPGSEMEIWWQDIDDVWYTVANDINVMYGGVIVYEIEKPKSNQFLFNHKFLQTVINKTFGRMIDSNPILRTTNDPIKVNAYVFASSTDLFKSELYRGYLKW